MRFQSTNFNYYSYIVIAVGIALSFILDTSKSYAASELYLNKSFNQALKSTFNKTSQNSNPILASADKNNLVPSKLPVLPELIDLVKAINY